MNALFFSNRALKALLNTIDITDSLTARTLQNHIKEIETFLDREFTSTWENISYTEAIIEHYELLLKLGFQEVAFEFLESILQNNEEEESESEIEFIEQ